MQYKSIFSRLNLPLIAFIAALAATLLFTGCASNDSGDSGMPGMSGGSQSCH